MKHADYCASYLNKGAEVLDIGAGRGTFLKQMAERGFCVSGIEANPAYIEEARHPAERSEISFDLRIGNAENLPYLDGQFDFVNASEVTEHVEDPVAMCHEIYRVLKPGARGYISFHNRFGVYDYHYHLYFINWVPRAWSEFILKLKKRQKQDGEAGRQKLTTMHYYTYGQVKKLLENVGFVFEDIRIGKIKKRFKLLSWLLLPLYFLFLRPLYLNTFHIFLIKSSHSSEFCSKG